MENFEVFPSQQLGYLGSSTTSRQIDKCNFQILCLGTSSNNKEKLHVPGQSTIGLASKTRLLKSLDKGALCLGHPFTSELPEYFFAGNHCRQRSLKAKISAHSTRHYDGQCWASVSVSWRKQKDGNAKPHSRRDTWLMAWKDFKTHRTYWCWYTATQD